MVLLCLGRPEEGDCFGEVFEGGLQGAGGPLKLSGGIFVSGLGAKTLEQGVGVRVNFPKALDGSFDGFPGGGVLGWCDLSPHVLGDGELFTGG